MLLKSTHIIGHILEQLSLFQNLERCHIEVFPSTQIDLTDIAVATWSWKLPIAEFLGNRGIFLEDLVVRLALHLLRGGTRLRILIIDHVNELVFGQLA